MQTQFTRIHEEFIKSEVHDDFYSQGGELAQQAVNCLRETTIYSGQLENTLTQTTAGSHSVS